MRTAVILSFVLVVIIASISVEGQLNQSRIIGSIRPGDRLLDRAWAVKTPRRGYQVRYDYKYPRFGWGFYTISCIRVMDKWYNGTNGDLYLNYGGVGARSVSLTILSKLSYGLQYDIEIWGR